VISYFLPISLLFIFPQKRSSKTLDPATPRVSARNQNKIIAEMEEKSAMELELENLPKIFKPSKIPKKSTTKKANKDIIEESEAENVLENEEIQIENRMEQEISIAEKAISKKQTPKKSTKKASDAEEDIIENSEIAAKKTMSTRKPAKKSEIVEETEISNIPKSAVKKSKKQEKEELVAEEEQEEEEKVELPTKKTPGRKAKKVVLEAIGSENDDAEDLVSNIVVPVKTPKKSKKSKDNEEEEEKSKLMENEFSEKTPEKSVKTGNKKTKNGVTDSQVKKARK
jgi:hypothetical protein